MKYTIYKGIAVVLFSFCVFTIHAQQSITGFVFEDINHNGSKDKNEPGIQGVAVSNQLKVVVSGKDGVYNITGGKGYGIIFISVPEGYAITDSFWKTIDSAKSETPVNFSLTKSKPVTSFTFIHASDTHISPESIDRMKRLGQITDSVKPDLMLITGDLVKDALRVNETTARSLYDLFKSEKARINTTVWTIPGNHEIFGIERHLSLVSSSHPLYGRKMYRYYFGPDYYSFNYGGVHFIGLNSLVFEDLWYYGKIDSLQLEWLKQDVAVLSPKTPVVTFQHVPFYSGGLSIQPFEENGPGRVIELEDGVLQYRHIVTNASDVLQILANYNYPLALAGHYHYQQKFSFAGMPTRFEQTGAVVGPTGEGSLQMPSGVMLYSVKNGKIDEGKFIPMDK